MNRLAGLDRRDERKAPGPLDAVLRAKLYVPAVRRDWIERPDLLAALEDPSVARLVLIVAPAGSGKSTLLSLWRADPPKTGPVAVYAADERDNDPSVLWTGLVTALADALPDMPVDDLVQALSWQSVDIPGMVLPALVDRLREVPDPLALVIDDYHSVSAATCHEQVRNLLTALPPGCRLVLATRTVPRHLPIARLRAAGELVEIRATDLRLSDADLTELMRRVAGVGLPDAARERLSIVTEGWATGVYLAALAARGHDDPSVILSGFGGSHRNVHDYLFEQVLAELPDEHQAVLSRLSITDRFCADLCRAVTGQDWVPVGDDDAPHLFVVPLDDQRRWYRFHHLFQQTLWDRLNRTEPALVPTLHRRAATWFARHGLIDDSIDHSLTGGDTKAAVDLIARSYVGYVNSGRVATVAAWLDRLGPDVVGSSAPAALCAAWTAAVTGNRAAFQHWLQLAEDLGHEGPLPDGTRSVTSSVALARAIFGLDGITATVAAAQTASDIETDPTSPWYGLATVALGFARYLLGHPDEALAPLEAALENQATMPMVRLAATSALALAMNDLGRHDQASELAAAAHRQVGEYGLTHAPQASIVYTALGVVAAQRGDHPAALEHLHHSLTMRRRYPGLAPWPALATLLPLARLHHRLGDDDTAGVLLDEAEGLLAAIPSEQTRVHRQVTLLRRALNVPDGERTEPAEPLSERELAVLRLLSTPLTKREIADQLYVSINTVKTQTAAIYRKLGATSRADAIHRARTLGIVT